MNIQSLNCVLYTKMPLSLVFKGNETTKPKLFSYQLSKEDDFWNHLGLTVQDKKDKIEASQVLETIKSNNCSIEILKKIENLPNSTKENFIRQYCSHTGFPNLEKVNTIMKDHITSVMNDASLASGAKILSANYSKSCSVNSGLALPGSDFDASSVILDTDSQRAIDYFKGYLWNNMDPSLVSIRRDYEFPDVFSINQIYEWVIMLDELIKENDLEKKSNTYKENLKIINPFKKALEFNIDLAHILKPKTTNKDNSNADKFEYFRKKCPSFDEALTRDGAHPIYITQAMSSCLESLRSGNNLITNNLTPEQKQKLNRIKDSYLYKYGNICIQEADFPLKNKLKKRKTMINEDFFKSLSLEEKTDLILRMYYETFHSFDKNRFCRHYGTQFEKIFDNGSMVDEERNSAFQESTAI